MKDDIKFGFLYFWFKLNRTPITEMESVNTVKGISLVDLKKIPFWRPVREKQTANAQLLSDGDTEISKLETKLARTRKLNKGFMHELLTERIRL